MTQRGTQKTVLAFMIGMCSLNSQHAGQYASCECYLLFCSYTNDHQGNLSNLKLPHSKGTREDNKQILYCYFRSNPTQRVYRKELNKFELNLLDIRKQPKYLQIRLGE